MWRVLRGLLNLGILAHVDAGKTTLTERLLYSAGVISEPGSVDAGTTRTDALALERQRGITIRSAVVSFPVEGVSVNLIDTPGHPDFVAEVECALHVLDGVVLVISAVEGVQPQTSILWRTLRRLRVPTLLFVNKIDRRGADHERLLVDIAERLTSAAVPMGSVRGIGTPAAEFVPFADTDPVFRSRLVEALAECDDAVLAAYVGDGTLPGDDLFAKLAEQTKNALVQPVYFGSTITGAGVDALLGALTWMLPRADQDAAGPVSGRVFKIDRGDAGAKVAYVRMFSGTVRVRDRVRFGAGRERKVTAISVFADGVAEPRTSVCAGQIATLAGLAEIQIGDVIGVAPHGGDRHHFAPPTLETAVVPRHPRDKAALHAALTQLAEQDPLINVRQDDQRQEIYVIPVRRGAETGDRGHVGDRLRGRRGIPGNHADLCGTADRNRYRGGDPARTGKSVPRHHGDPGRAGGRGFWDRIPARRRPSGGAAVYLQERPELRSRRRTVRPADAAGGAVRLAGHRLHGGTGPVAVQRSRRPTVDPGPLSTPQDFRGITTLVVMAALRAAGTVVCEPVHRFRLDAPTDTLTVLLPALAKLRAVPEVSATIESWCTVDGDIPAARVHELRQQLPVPFGNSSLLFGGGTRAISLG
jgi:ribosomal protection tetracycline resistance protein